SRARQLLLRPGESSVDISKVPLMPFLPSPLVAVGNQPSSLTVTITQVVRCIESLDQPSVGLKKGLESVGKDYSSLMFKPINDLKLKWGNTEADAWTVVFVSIRNTTRSAVRLPLNTVTLVRRNSTIQRTLTGVLRVGRLVDFIGPGQAD